MFVYTEHYCRKYVITVGKHRAVITALRDAVSDFAPAVRRRNVSARLIQPEVTNTSQHAVTLRIQCILLKRKENKIRVKCFFLKNSKIKSYKGFIIILTTLEPL